METPLHLPVADGAAVRILQITDTHLFAGETDTLLGINTLHSYHAVLDAIVKQQLPADLIVATGDLVQDQSTRAGLSAVYGRYCPFTGAVCLAAGES